MKLLLIIFSLLKLCYSIIEAPDGSGILFLFYFYLSLILFYFLFLFLFLVCFNGCSGHGDCRDYSCYCWTGYHGDDCSVSK